MSRNIFIDDSDRQTQNNVQHANNKIHRSTGVNQSINYGHICLQRVFIEYQPICRSSYAIDFLMNAYARLFVYAVDLWESNYSNTALQYIMCMYV